MNRILSLVVLSIAALASTACVNRYLDEASSQQPRGGAFENALARDYLAMAKSEYQQSDHKDGDTFARRSIAAAQGKPTQPDEIRLRHLPSDAEDELSQARQRLVTALDRNGRTTKPTAAARAQVMFDCWIEQQEENIQPDHIAACRDGFMTAMRELEAAPPPAPPAAVAPRAPDRFLVFFDWDKATLTAEGRRVIANAVDAAKRTGAATLTATGYTDRSGPDAYNQRLSVRRAEAVKAELVRLGVPTTSITTIGRGETNPLVPTADGVREAQNRRVEITIER